MGDRSALWIRVTVWVAVIYGALILLLFIATLLVGSSELKGMLETVLSLLLFLAFGLLPLTLVARRWYLAGIAAAALAGWGLTFGPYLLPRSRPVPPEQRPLTFVTWNIQAGNEDLEEIAAIIRQADPDVLALQELGIPAADYLGPALRPALPHQALYPQDNGHEGHGVLSRFPVLDSRLIEFPDLSPSLPHLRADLDVAGTTLTVYSVHPVPPYSLEKGLALYPHRMEIERVLEMATADSGPTVLMGDWNMTDRFDAYRAVTAAYTDVFREVGHSRLGFSYPEGQRFPLPRLVRLDYIFYGGALAGIRSDLMGESGPSDHRPLWADLVLTP